MRIRKTLVLAALSVLFGSCSTLPPLAEPTLVHSPLLSLSLYREVSVPGAEEKPLGVLANREAYWYPFEQGSQNWFTTILEGWESAYPEALRWQKDSTSGADYQAITKIPEVDSFFGWEKPDAVRYSVPSGDWNYVGANERDKWGKLTRLWGPSVSLEGRAYYFVFEGRESTSQVYQLRVRTLVTLWGEKGEPLAQTLVEARSETRSFRSLSAARRELEETLPEAAQDFLKRWKR